MNARVFWIELNGLAKFRDRWFWKMPKSVSASNQCVESGRISHGLLQMLKPLLGIGESLGVR